MKSFNHLKTSLLATILLLFAVQTLSGQKYNLPTKREIRVTKNKIIMNPEIIADKKIVFMGNSITEGWSIFDKAFFKDMPYINKGVSGQTTGEMLARFQRDVIDLQPSMVVILAGINDIAENQGYVPLDRIFGNIIAMAEQAKEHNIKVIMSSVLPALDFPWRPGMQPKDKIIALNAMLAKYAAVNGITYVDYYSVMVDENKALNDAYTYDGVHPNKRGYRVMGPLLEDAILKTL